MSRWELLHSLEDDGWSCSIICSKTMLRKAQQTPFDPTDMNSAKVWYTHPGRVRHATDLHTAYLVCLAIDRARGRPVPHLAP
eukprot:10376840-Lingulodinium_polyedra.AAC.1